MELALPDIRFQKSYIQAQREFRAEGRAVDINFDELKLHFPSFVQRKLKQRDGLGLPKGFVPCSEFWMIEEQRFVGRIVLRHHLNEALGKFGGHIGYEVRPTERRKGFAQQAVAMVFPEARARGLAEVLITCDDDNLGSIKVIERNHGRLVDKIQIKGREVLTRRYLVSV